MHDFFFFEEINTCTTYKIQLTIYFIVASVERSFVKLFFF